MGIEPTLAAWEAAVLPLNYTRTFEAIITGPVLARNLLQSGYTGRRVPSLATAFAITDIMIEHSLNIVLNGQPHQLSAPISIAELLVQLGHQHKRVAVELNREIVPKSRHAVQQLADGDQLELVHAMGGG